MNSRLKKFLLLAFAAALLTGVAQVQSALNRERNALDLTRAQALENAPPVLAFTTVALGGFRGLIANALWIRASELQDEDKFFEMAQLADWITKLEPHFVQVWLVQAWNMAYNISVKFKESAPGQFPDRWRWVQRGIALLRDEGLRYNPNELLIYRELAWFYQHKLGANLDDANVYYKQQWADEMAAVLGQGRPNFDELIHPQTEEAKRRAAVLRDKYKLNPELMKKVDAEYGPLEWRLPEAHAIYWAEKGLEEAKQNPGKVNKEDLVTLRRVIYQSMQLSFQRGRLVDNPFDKEGIEFGPNLDIIAKVNRTYDEMIKEDESKRDLILKAQMNFLCRAVYLLYENNRLAEAAKWYEYIGAHWPEHRMLPDDPDSLPSRLPLGDYVGRMVQEDIHGANRDLVKAAIEGYLVRAFRSLVLGQDDEATGLRLIARQVWATYSSVNVSKERLKAIEIPPVEEIEQDVLKQLLDPEHGWPPQVRAVLRQKLGMPQESAAPPAATPSTGATNAPATGPAR